MRRIEVSRQPIDPKLFGKAAHSSHISQVVEEDAEVIVDGRLALAYFPQAPGALDRLMWAFRNTSYAVSFRTLGLSTRSATIGFAPRVAFHRDFCSVSAMSYKHPKQHEIYMEYARKAASTYKQLNPGKYIEQMKKLDVVRPQWIIPETPFTSGIVNKDNVLAYHRDQGNFKDCWSCMYAAAENCDGGLLAVPELGLGFSFAQPALIMFDGASLLHGVTPMKQNSPLAHRYSCVFYSLQGMAQCMTTDEELIRIRRLKTLREKDRAKAIPPLWAQYEVGKVTAQTKVVLVQAAPDPEVASIFSDAYLALVDAGAHVDIIKLSKSAARQRSLSFPVPRLVGGDRDHVSHVMMSEHPTHLARTIEELNRYDIVVAAPTVRAEILSQLTPRVLTPDALVIGDDPSKLKEILT